MSPQTDNCLAGPTRVERVITINLSGGPLRFEPELKNTRPFTPGEMQRIATCLANGATFNIDFGPAAQFEDDITTAGHEGIDQRIKQTLKSYPAMQKLVYKIMIGCKQARLVQGIVCLEHVDVEVICGESDHIKIQDLMSAKLHPNGDITFPPAATA